jgi:tRNA nucleotidyltransferase/poly(A) polymerase
MASIREILKALEDLAERKGLSRPYVVGGVPRDKYIGRPDIINDIDVTTGDASVHQLAREFANFYPIEHFKILGDGHAQIGVQGFKVDFSSNYRAPGIEEQLHRVGVADPTDMIMELLSRDFTCNTLLLTPDLQMIKDPTGLGITDIKRRLVRTCLSPDQTLRNDTKRVVRILYMAAKLHFNVDPEIIEWVRANPETIAQVKPKYLSDKLQESLNLDRTRTIQLLDAMALWPHVPMTPDLAEYAAQSARRI